MRGDSLAKVCLGFLFLLLCSCRYKNTLKEVNYIIDTQVDNIELNYYVEILDTTEDWYNIVPQSQVLMSDEQEKLLDVLGGVKRGLFKCAYHGKILFKNKDDVLIEAEFNISEECKHIVLMYNKHIVSCSISDKAIPVLLNYFEKLPSSQNLLKK